MDNVIGAGLYRDFLVRMIEISRTEEALENLYREGLVHGTMHLCIGEEAADTGSAMALSEGDLIFTTHRGHGTAIAKGADIGRLIAEILGRTGSSNGGIGGSMHLTDPEAGVVGGNGVVGAGVPIALGAALTIKTKKIPDRVAAAYLGDGAANQGAVMESMNLAGVLGLPVIFILIDNGYAVSTRVERGSAKPDFASRAEAFGLRAYEADGDDVVASYLSTGEAREYTLSAHAPSFVVLHTYRVSGHSRSDDGNYRSPEEVARHRDPGPIGRYIEFLLERGIFDEEDIMRFRLMAEEHVDEALDYACRRPEVDISADRLEQMVYTLQKR